MLATLGLLALAVLGAEGPPQAKPEPSPLTYQLQVYEMKGLGWRAAVHDRLQPVARQGSATIWTANRATARELGSLADSVKQAPQVTARSGVPVHVAPGASQRDEAQVRQAAFTPEEKALRPKCSATFTGRKLDQGVLTKFVLEETRILAVHQVAYSSTKGAPVNSVIGVPEVASSDVIGEWLIPNDGALVISLGVHTVAAADGKAEVRERLIVLEAQTTTIADRLKTTSFIPWSPGSGRDIPVAPTHSLPQPFRPDGKPAELPPLPDDVTPTSLPNSSEPCASPQARFTPEPDKALQRTSVRFELPPSAAPIAFIAAKALQGVADRLTGMDKLRAMRLPPGKYMHDDVQYFQPGPDFPWANTQAKPRRAGVYLAVAPTIPPPKNAPDLTGKKVVILTSSRAGSRDLASIDCEREFGREFARNLRENVEKIELVSPEKVTDWMEAHPDWIYPDDAARAFGADMVIFLEIEQFQLQGEGDFNMLQGTSKTHIKVIELVYPTNSRGNPLDDQPKEARTVYDDSQDSVFPIRGPLLIDKGMSRGAFRKKFISVVAAECSWHFIEHAQDDMIQDTKFDDHDSPPPPTPPAPDAPSAQSRAGVFFRTHGGLGP